MDESRKSIRELIDQLMLSIIYDIYVISFSEGSIYRRGARRWRKLYRVNGHIFQAKRFNRVSIISFNYHCSLFITSPFSPPPPHLSYAVRRDRSFASATRRRKRILCVYRVLLWSTSTIYSKTCWLV